MLGVQAAPDRNRKVCLSNINRRTGFPFFFPSRRCVAESTKQAWLSARDHVCLSSQVAAAAHVQHDAPRSSADIPAMHCDPAKWNNSHGLEIDQNLGHTCIASSLIFEGCKKQSNGRHNAEERLALMGWWRRRMCNEQTFSSLLELAKGKAPRKRHVILDILKRSFCELVRLGWLRALVGLWRPLDLSEPRLRRATPEMVGHPPTTENPRLRRRCAMFAYDAWREASYCNVCVSFDTCHK